MTPIFSIAVRRMAPPVAIELRFHQMLAEMDDMHLAAVIQQAARRFEPEQAAADHDRFLAGFACSRDHAVAVVERAEPEHAGFSSPSGVLSTFHRRNEGAAAGRDQKLVVMHS